MAILEVRGLEKYYGQRKVVDGVGFDVAEGEVVGLLGPNGAGKTTSFRMTTGQIEPNGGSVKFCGFDVTSKPMYRRARLGMGYLSQEPSVFRRLTVEKNILAVLEMLPMSRSLGRKLRRSERWDRTDAVIKQFGLDHVRHNNVWRCSGGEKRRVEIARCLVCEPRLILLDEPFAGVDPLTKDDIRQIVRDLAKQGIAILMTDHDVTQVLKSTDRIYLITKGRVRTQGSPTELIRDQIAIDEYLGESYRNALDGLSGIAPGAVTFAAATPQQMFAPAVYAEPAPVQPAYQPPVLRMDEVLEGEKIRRLIEALRYEDQANEAFGELVRRGIIAVPALLEVMERRGDLDLRVWSVMALQHILGSEAVVIDAYAPEPSRREEVARLRDRLLRRRAG